MYGPDLMLAISGLSAERGFRYFLYGGREGVAEWLSARLRGNSPACKSSAPIARPSGRSPRKKTRGSWR